MITSFPCVPIVAVIGRTSRRPRASFGEEEKNDRNGKRPSTQHASAPPPHAPSLAYSCQAPLTGNRPRARPPAQHLACRLEPAPVTS